MDPLAAPLSCPCVKGYAQRDYEKLGIYLEKQLGQKTHVVFAEDLGKALKASPSHRLDLVIGKHSVVRYDAAEYHLTVRPLAMLTGKEGGTTITGWFIVPKDDPAKTITDLRDYTILFGPADCDEKHSAAIVALTKAGITVPAKVETRAGCSDSALDILENKTSQRMAGVISSYAAPLLEGCGTVPKGSLRVVGRTAEVPFVGVFATATVNEKSEKKILAALLSMKDEPSLLKALETKNGFVPLSEQATEKAEIRGSVPQLPDIRSKRIEKFGPPTKTSTSTASPGWPGCAARIGTATWQSCRKGFRPNRKSFGRCRSAGEGFPGSWPPAKWWSWPTATPRTRKIYSSASMQKTASRFGNSSIRPRASSTTAMLRVPRR